MMYDTGNFSSELCLPGGGTSNRPSRPKAVAQYSSSFTVVLDASTPVTVTFDATAFQRGIVPITYSEFKVTTAGVYLLWAEVMIGHEAGAIVPPGHKANSWFTVNDVPVAGTGGHMRGLSLAEAGIIAQAVVQLAAGDKIKLRLAGIKAQMEPFAQPSIPAAPAASMTIQEI